MGAWDAGSFDNDAACDWAVEFAKSKDLAPVFGIFARALDAEYIDGTSGCQAIAACEVIARLKGNIGTRNPFSQKVDDWVSAHPQQIPKDLVQTALEVLVKVRSSKSELSKLWCGGVAAEWQTAMDDLRQRVIA